MIVENSLDIVTMCCTRTCIYPLAEWCTVVNMEQPGTTQIWNNLPWHIFWMVPLAHWMDGTGTVALGPCTVPCPSSQADNMLSSTTEPRSEPNG